MVVDNLMSLEQQLLQEIQERQAKLKAIQQAKPKLQTLTTDLDECFSSFSSVGMQDLLLNLLKDKLNTWGVTPAQSPTITPTPTPSNTQSQTPTNTQTPVNTKTKDEFKTWVNFSGKRLRDETAKEMCIAKLSEISREDLLNEVNLDDKDNFWVEIEKLLELIKTPIPTPVINEVPTPVIETLPSATPEIVKTIEPVTPTTPEVTLISPEEIVKGAIAQNLLTQQIGIIQVTGIVADVSGTECAVIQYRGGIAHTPITQLKLIAPATQAPTTTTTPIEKAIQEIKNVEQNPPTPIKELTPQDLHMWEELKQSGFDEAELNSFAVDPDIVRSYNSQNNTNLTSLPIAALYTYTLNKTAIQ